MKRLLLLTIICLSLFAITGCTSTTKAYTDGYYTAEALAFDDYGWKEYVTICVSDDRIVSVEYDARNASGFIKSWDMNYMRVMNETDGTYPNQYARQYAGGLVNRQNPDRVDAVSGATHSHISFQLLAKACIEQARAGGSDIVYVEIPTFEEEPVVSSGGEA